MEDRKVFMGGLAWTTGEQQIRDYFSQFGKIEHVNLKIDQMSGRSRGFGFLVFGDSSSVEQVLDGRVHVIDDKKIDVKRAKARPGKVFVGGVQSLEESDIRDYFAQFGTVTEVERPYDKARGQPKNFCFVTFEQDSVLKSVLMNPRQTISCQPKSDGDGSYREIEVDVKKVTAKPRDDQFGQGGMGGPAGGNMGYQQGWTGYPASYYGGQAQGGYGSGYGGYSGGNGGYGGGNSGYGGGNSGYGGGNSGYGGGNGGYGGGGYDNSYYQGGGEASWAGYGGGKMSGGRPSGQQQGGFPRNAPY